MDAGSGSAVDSDDASSAMLTPADVRRYTFLVVVILVTVLNAAAFVKFWKKRDLQPIKGR